MLDGTDCWPCAEKVPAGTVRRISKCFGKKTHPKMLTRTELSNQGVLIARVERVHIDLSTISGKHNGRIDLLFFGARSRDIECDPVR